MAGRSAVHDALNAFRQPAILRSLWLKSLPPDMLQVIKIASGDDETIDQHAAAAGSEAANLRDAADFYLRQLFLHAGKRRHLILGLGPKATAEDVRIHKRWMLKWLHPDRAGSEWKAAYFKVVADAARSLEAELAGETQSPAEEEVPPKSLRPSLSGRRVATLEKVSIERPAAHLSVANGLWRSRSAWVVVATAAILAALAHYSQSIADMRQWLLPFVAGAQS